MEKPTQPPEPQTPDDDPAVSTALWAIGGFIIFAAMIFALIVGRL